MGMIIYVCGLYGAGKTTLVKATRGAIPQLESIPTYTTRKPRQDEIKDNNERLSFVSTEDYKRLRSRSKEWDHTEILSIYYGTDTSLINYELAEGQSYIVTAPADVEKLKEMQSHYRADHIVIWVDTDLNVANHRLLNRDKKEADIRIMAPTQSRERLELGRSNADIIFHPTGDLETDKSEFIKLIRKIIS